MDVTDSVGYSVGAIEGNVLDTTASGDMQDSGQGISVTSAVSDSVDGSTPVNVTSAGVDITGAYGVLTIHSDGSYSYQLTKGGAAIGKSVNSQSRLAASFSMMRSLPAIYQMQFHPLAGNSVLRILR